MKMQTGVKIYLNVHVKNAIYFKTIQAFLPTENNISFTNIILIFYTVCTLDFLCFL